MMNVTLYLMAGTAVAELSMLALRDKDGRAAVAFYLLCLFGWPALILAYTYLLTHRRD